MEPMTPCLKLQLEREQESLCPDRDQTRRATRLPLSVCQITFRLKLQLISYQCHQMYVCVCVCVCVRVTMQQVVCDMDPLM